MSRRNEPCKKEDSCLESPMPYLLAALGAMTILIIITQTLRLISYLRTSHSRRSPEQQHQQQQQVQVQVIPPSGGKPGAASTQDSSRRIAVIMAGDDTPTFIAQPAAVGGEPAVIQQRSPEMKLVTANVPPPELPAFPV